MAEFTRERLWIPTLFGVLGFLAFLHFAGSISPQASFDFRLTRVQVIDSAATFMKGLGYDLSGLTVDAWIVQNPVPNLFLQQEYGIARANEIVRSDSIPASHWEVSWYNRNLSISENPERFTVYMSPAGRVLRYSHEILDTVARPTIAPDTARRMAEAVLAKFHPDFPAYTLKTSSDIKQTKRVDHEFIYERHEHGVELDLFARVQGDEVAEIRWDATIDREFNSRLSGEFTTAAFFYTVSMVASFLLFFFVVILFLKKYHEGEVGTRMAFLVFLGYFAVGVLSVLNQFPGIGASTMIGDLNKTYVRLITTLLWVFVLQLFMAVLAFSAWSVGESSSRSVWAGKMTSMDALLSRRFFTSNGGESLIRGYGWGLAILGVHAVVLAVLVRAGKVMYPVSLQGLPESYLPGLQPVLFALTAALFGEVVTRLFFVSYLREKTGRVWLGVVVSVLVWTCTALWQWEIPIGSLARPWNLVVVASYGVLFIVLFLRYDLLTALTAHFVAVALGVAIPLFSSTGDAFAGSRVMFCAAMVVPLLVAVIGIVRRKRFEFTPEIMPNHILRISERVRMAKELEIARNVQMSLLPKEHPKIEGYEIAGLCIPAQEVGGDYFDFVRLGARKLGIALGDVSGKGVPAAIYMTLTKGILQSNAEESVTPKAVLTKVNGLMYRTIERNSFVSMLYAVLDGDASTLRFARAGQCPILLTAGAGGDERFLTTKGMALGLERGDTFNNVLEEVELKLQPGELLVFYTDGFTEAMNVRNEEFGESRFLESVRRHRAEPVDLLIQAIVEDVRAYVGNVAQHDDMTIVAVKVHA